MKFKLNIHYILGDGFYSHLYAMVVMNVALLLFLSRLLATVDI